MKNVILKMIKFYQKIFSPDHGIIIFGTMRCRFWPSCSQYTIEAVEKHGIIRGLIKGSYRIIRCNPWSKGGIDML